MTTRVLRRSRFVLASILGCLGLIAISISSCSSTKVNENDPQSVFQDAEADIKAKRFQIAVDKLRALKNKFPYSSLAPLAQLKIGDAYFAQELYQEAALTYEAFRDLYPKHEKAPYALFKMGEAYQKDMPAIIWRDLASAVKALEAFEAYVEQYPKGSDFENAKEMIGVVRERLAEKEYLIGKFYLRDKHFEAARNRFEKVLRMYPESSVAVQARQKLNEADKGLKE